MTEILRVSGMIPNHGLSDFDRLQRGSPSPMASFDMMANNRGTGFNGWNGLPHDVSNCNFVNLRIAPSVYFSGLQFLHSSSIPL